MKHAFGTCVKSTKICNAMPDGWTCIACMYDFMSVNTVCRDLAIAITAHCHILYIKFVIGPVKVNHVSTNYTELYCCYYLHFQVHYCIFVNCSYMSPFVTWLWKTDQVVTFGISRNTNFKYLSYCSSLVLDCSHARYTV